MNDGRGRFESRQLFACPSADNDEDLKFTKKVPPMPLTIHAERPPLRETEGGVIRIADTRIPLERVIRAFLAGSTPEQIVHDFDVLAIEDVYAVVTYYLRNRAEVDDYLAAAAAETQQFREEAEKRYDQTGIRTRLLARRSFEAG
jgi:uncharacterized protein (DUF433 family)